MIIVSRYKVGIMALWFGSIFLLSYFLLPSWLLKYVENNLEFQVSQKIKVTTDYLEKHKSSLAIIAQDQATVSLCSQIALDDHALLSYAEALKTVNWNNHFFSDLSVIAKNGTILFSQKNKSLQGKNIGDFSYKNKPLGQVFNHIAIKQASDICFFKSTHNAQQVLLVIVPVLLKEGVIGFVFGEIASAELCAMLLKNYSSCLSVDTFLATAIEDVLTVIPLNKKQQAYFKESISYYEELLDASSGGINKGIVFGKNLNSAIGFWSHHPLLEAGLITTFSYKYIDYILYTVLFLAFFFFSICFLVIRKSIFEGLIACKENFLIFWNRVFQPYLIYFLLGLLLAGIVSSCMNFFYYRELNTKNSQIMTFEKTRYIGHELNKKLFSLEGSAKKIAQNLNNKMLSEEELDVLVKSILHESSEITAITIAFEPYAFISPKKVLEPAMNEQNSHITQEVSSGEKLFAPEWCKFKNGIDKKYIHSTYDYISDGEGFWYQETIKNELFWGSPYFDPISNKKIISYSMVFKNAEKSVCGVVRVSFPLETLTQFLKRLGRETYEQCLIYTHTGALIYHSNENYVAQNKTLFDLLPIQTTSLRELVGIYFKKYISGFNRYHKKGLIPYDVSQKGYDQLKARWEFSLGFSHNNIRTPTYYTYFWLMFTVVFFLYILFFGLLIAIKDYFLAQGRIYTFYDEILLGKFNFLVKKYSQIKAQSYFIILAFGCFLLWAMIYLKPWHHESTIVPIRDQGSVEHFLDKQSDEILRRGGKNFIPIKTGIVLMKLDDSKFPSLSLILQVWQTYTKDQLKTIEPGVILDKVEEMTATKIFEKEEGDMVSFSWKISARIDQQIDLAAYPFDKKNFILTFEPLDKKNNIICVPDFGKYPILSDNQYPWLDNKEILANLEASFFSYNKKDQPLEILSMKKSLNLHVVMKENLLNTLISYCIPLFIALFSIFALLWVNTEKRISGFSGLFFATIFLHRSLRSTLNLHSIVYLEYLFLITYFTLLIITTGSIFFKNNEKQMENIEYYFWPAQLTIWLVLATLLFF